MSTAPLQVISCPACEAPCDALPVAVIPEGTSDVDRLFEGTLNQIDCTACGNNFFIETPLLYRDDVNRYMVYYLPKALVPELGTAIENMQTLYKEIFAELEEDDQPICRLATLRNQFIEKIALHQFEYDDRIIEYVKYMLIQHNPGLNPKTHALLFDFGNSDDDNIMFVAFDRSTGEAAYTLGFTVDDFRALEETMFNSPDMQEELERAFREYYVTVDDLLPENSPENTD